jgi:hypothetical protein
MPDAKDTIVRCVREIDELNRQIAEHWSMIQRRIEDDRVDDAIPLLKAYLRLKTKLQNVESSLAGTLGGQFSDR